MKAIDILPGLVFTGKPGTGFFTGRIQIIDKFDNDKYARVMLTQLRGIKFSGPVEMLSQQSDVDYKVWFEDWLIEPVQQSFESGNYFEKTDWPGYPPLQNVTNSPYLKPKPVKPITTGPTESPIEPLVDSPIHPSDENQLTHEFNHQFSTAAAKILSDRPARIFLVLGSKKNGDVEMVFPPYFKMENLIEQLQVLVDDLKSKTDAGAKSNQSE